MRDEELQEMAAGQAQHKEARGAWRAVLRVLALVGGAVGVAALLLGVLAATYWWG